MNEKIATLRRARQGHKCTECGLPICPGEEYYELVTGGSGLASLKFPERVHLDCLNNHKEEKDGSD